MKQITKSTEPPEFADWKSVDKMAHRPNWNRVSSELKTVIHESLMREQGFICCYCESRIAMDDSHVEHFRPRTRIATFSSTTTICFAPASESSFREYLITAAIGKRVGSTNSC